MIEMTICDSEGCKRPALHETKDYNFCCEHHHQYYKHPKDWLDKNLESYIKVCQLMYK